ncbi:ubiquitin-like-specific protease 1A isoform X2 [Phalaenopsis equestris]|uniref:ubiquitin-like-specific protease 1A isoform X2 n=1 Tax=Phalaenopsis equestris TaxID=78828 RepID=UPI0009E47E1F|nr:ubiquitin-like-specific protease 1A isoform X2 [Phalaenopsis equestris]
MGNLFSQNCRKKHVDRFSMREPKKFVAEHSSAMGDDWEFNRAIGEEFCEKIEAPANMLKLQNIPGLWEKHFKELNEVFHPLTVEEDEKVVHALECGNSWEILVTHKPSNISITREVLQRLRPNAWLNDEVIDLYLELLKEREEREPKKFLKCHFFSTFFFKKLIGGGNEYDFRSVKRWTAPSKLGYSLIDCDRVFVPIHKDRHWCLAVVNIKDETFQYLDSLGGMDTYVLEVLAKYFMEEARDKSDKEIDTRFWKIELVDGLPLQINDWDCGMFMLKYIDFYSRALPLCFTQKENGQGDPCTES